MYTYEKKNGRIFQLGVVGRAIVTLEGRQRKRAESGLARTVGLI